MIYIKKFNEEAIHDEEVSNHHYIYDNRDNINKLIRGRDTCEWNQSEIDYIVERYNIPEYVFVRKGSYPTDVLCVSYPGGYMAMDRSILRLESRKYIFEITKYNDEWFKIKVEFQYGTMVHNRTRYFEYLCDQFDGLIKLLDDVKIF